MDQSEDDVLCISDERLKNIAPLMLLSGVGFFGFAFSVSEFGFDYANVGYELSMLSLGVIVLGISLFWYSRATRVEFYEDHIRAIWANGRKREVPYSQLYFKVVNLVGVRNLGPPRGAALWVKGEHRLLGNLKSDISVKGHNTFLFEWLSSKVDKPPEPKKQ